MRDPLAMPLSMKPSSTTTTSSSITLRNATVNYAKTRESSPVSIPLIQRNHSERKIHMMQAQRIQENA
jgi:hypothetical protein